MPRLTSSARAAGRTTVRAGECCDLGLAQARRFLLLQGRLRSNEPTQIFVCAVFGRWSAR